MSEKAYEQKLAAAVIRRSLLDVGSGKKEDAKNAELYISKPIFLAHCEAAGYPLELRESLRSLASLSPLQRRVGVKELLEVLHTEF